MDAGNGYTRQAALDAVHVGMASTPLLCAVLTRLNDWVPQVRVAAQHAIDRMWDSITAPMLLAALPHIERLGRAGRASHTAIVHRIEARMLDTSAQGGAQHIRQWMHTGDGAVACFCYDLLVRRAQLDEAQLCAWGLECPHPHVARRAAQRLHHLQGSAEHLHTLVEQALQSRYGGVRLAALRAARPSATQPLDGALGVLALRAALDRNTSVRNIAVMMLGGPSASLCTHAISVLEDAKQPYRRQAIALALLGEMGSLAPTAQVLQGLEHPSPTLRRAAYGAAFQLGVLRADDLILKALQDPTISVQKTALQWAYRLKTAPTASELQAIAHRLDAQGWHTMLHLMRLGNPWELLITLLALPERFQKHCASTAPLATHGLHWIQTMNRCFLEPSPPQRAQLALLLANAGKHRMFAPHMRALSWQLDRFHIPIPHGKA